MSGKPASATTKNRAARAHVPVARVGARRGANVNTAVVGMHLPMDASASRSRDGEIKRWRDGERKQRQREKQREKDRGTDREKKRKEEKHRKLHG